MAGSSVAEPGHSRRKSLDAEVNLVPFIDLLSMCISFLLLTAAWISVGAVQIKQSHGTDAPLQAASQYDLKVQFVNSASLQIELKKGKISSKRKLEAPTSEALLQKLDLALADWNETREPAQVSAVKFTSKADVTYGDLVNIMDVFRKHQIVNLAVLPGGAT